MRNRENPYRPERLKNFDTCTRIWPGYAGNRRWKRRRRHTWGVDSIVTQTLRSQLHEDAVHGTSEAAPMVNALFDPEWSGAQERALERKGSLQQQIQERRFRAKIGL